MPMSTLRARTPWIHHACRLLAAAAFLALAAASGCGAIVGDACETDTDCGSGLFCEHTLPGGYCTLSNCEERSCPEEGICVNFTLDESWCMAPCSSGADCRSSYQCVPDFGAHPFCHAASPPP